MKGTEVKNFLKSRGIVLSRLAEQLGMSQQNLNSLLTKDDVRSSLLERICEATGLPISMFYGGSSIALTSGENSPAVSGNNNHVGTQPDRFLDELAAQRALTEKSQEQIDRLLGVIERLSGK